MRTDVYDADRFSDVEKAAFPQYYKGILKTLEIYVLVSIADLIFKAAVLGEEVTLWSAIRGILAFEAANYSWYIEMYIGLFL